MNNDDDGYDELSRVMWRLHFTTERVVTGIVNGVYNLPQDFQLQLNDSIESVPSRVRKRGRRKLTLRMQNQSALKNSATFQRLLLQARVIRDKMNGSGQLFPEMFSGTELFTCDKMRSGTELVTCNKEYTFGD